MCVEVYSKDQPVQILFEHENFRFLSERSFRGRYILLVRNAGFEPIHVLSVIFPRPLYRVEEIEENGKLMQRTELAGVRDVTAELPTFSSFFADQPRDKRLRMVLPDPNNPTSDLPEFAGHWDPDVSSVEWELPETLRDARWRCVQLLNENRFTLCDARLTRPIPPGQAQWFAWEFTVEQEGVVVENTLLGPVVFHQIASPIDVRRTLVERLQGALKDIAECSPPLPGDEEERIAIRTLLFNFGLHQERRVDIHYYELTVETGDPNRLFLVQSIQQGDIWMRSESPRVGRKDSEWDRERKGEPVYEWKSGSILEPSHPWQNSGFSLRLTLAFKPAT